MSLQCRSRVWKNKKHKESTNTQKGKPWFGAQCANARRDFHKAKKRFDNVKTEHNKTNLKHKGKAYKKAINKHYRRYIDSYSNGLRYIKKRDPKLYWKKITRKKKNKATSFSRCILRIHEKIERKSRRYKQ